MPVRTRPINTRRRTNSPKFNHVRGHGCRNDSLAKLAGKLEFEPDFPKFVVHPPKSSREFVVVPPPHLLDVSARTVKAFFPFPLISVIRASCFRDVTIEREWAHRGGGGGEGRADYALLVFSYKPIDTEFRVPWMLRYKYYLGWTWGFTMIDSDQRCFGDGDRDDCRRVVSWKFRVLNLEWSIAGLTKEQLGEDSLRDFEREGGFGDWGISKWLRSNSRFSSICTINSW